MSTIYVQESRIIGQVTLPPCPECGGPLALTYKHGQGTGDPEIPYSFCLYCWAERKIRWIIKW